MRKPEEIIIGDKTLKAIIDAHQHWLNGDCDGRECMQANLSGANLDDTDLGGENLVGAILDGASLVGANLTAANLAVAIMDKTNLDGAHLYGANLDGARLFRASLIETDLQEANLNGATLIEANLNGALLDGANLKNARLVNAINIPFIPYTCPDFGMFIGYKRAQNRIVELEIPSDARRCSATGRKCRCDKAKVLGIYDYSHNLLDEKEVASNHDNSFIYRVGEMVEEPNFCDNRWKVCAPGIHFFINFQEAVNY